MHRVSMRLLTARTLSGAETYKTHRVYVLLSGLTEGGQIVKKINPNKNFAAKNKNNSCKFLIID